MKRNKILARCCASFLIILSLVFISFGFVLLLYFPQIYDGIIYKALDLSPNSPAFEAWKVNEPPLELDFYFFNWTNPKEIYNSDIKPRFEQVGPYRFKEVKEKYDIVFHENDTISYKSVKRYYFMKEESPRPLTDVINTVNAVALSAAYKSRFLSPFRRVLFSMSLSSTSPIYVTKTIDELLFTGYDDRLLSVVSALAPFLSEGNINDKFGYFYKTKRLLSRLCIKKKNGTLVIEFLIPYSHSRHCTLLIGFYVAHIVVLLRNNTYGLSGDFSVYKGHNERFGKILSWNHSNRTDFYKGKCGEIRGSAGEFHPLDRKRDILELYSSEMCMTAVLEYEKDVEIKGIKAYKYSANTLFDNGAKNPDNACYCNGECIPAGVLNISSCRMNAPMFLSLPHFYNADPYYTTVIDGMKPDKEKHDFYITTEPKTAITVDVGGRMQLNMLLQPLAGISLYQNVPKIFVPIFYFDQVVTVADDLVFSLTLLQNMPEISQCAAYIFISIGILIVTFIVISYLCAFSKKVSTKKKKYKISQSLATPDEIPLRTKSDIS